MISGNESCKPLGFPDGERLLLSDRSDPESTTVSGDIHSQERAPAKTAI